MALVRRRLRRARRGRSGPRVAGADEALGRVSPSTTMRTGTGRPKWLGQRRLDVGPALLAAGARSAGSAARTRRRRRRRSTKWPAGEADPGPLGERRQHGVAPRQGDLVARGQRSPGRRGGAAVGAAAAAARAPTVSAGSAPGGRGCGVEGGLGRRRRGAGAGERAVVVGPASGGRRGGARLGGRRGRGLCGRVDGAAARAAARAPNPACAAPGGRRRPAAAGGRACRRRSSTSSAGVVGRRSTAVRRAALGGGAGAVRRLGGRRGRGAARPRAGGRRTPRRGGGAAGAPRSRRAMRSARAATEVSASGRVRRTSATSSGMRGSRASWMPTNASPSTSSARVAPGAVEAAGLVGDPLLVAARRGGRGRRSTEARKTSRSRAMSASPSTRGLRPRLMRGLDRDERPPGVVLAERLDQLVDGVDRVGYRRRRRPPGRGRRACRGPSRRRPAARRRGRPGRARGRRRRRRTRRGPARSAAGSRCTSKCWVRLRMVGSTFCGSVVASTNTTWSGGSSSVFSSAFDAAVESMWTSSRMYTFVRPGVPSDALAMRSRMASTPLLEAASSSWTSKLVPASMARHEAHSQSGSPSTGFAQLRTLARMRAVEVLPVPRGPLNR